MTTAMSAPISRDDILDAHLGGKLRVDSTRPLDSATALSIAYTPGVAEVSRAIEDDPSMATSHTWAGRLVAVVSDGTAVLGLGNVGPRAALPVMEGKSALFRRFGGLNSIPLVLDTTDVNEIVATLVRLRPSYGAINLEDISAPRCFELERRLIEAVDCPVMHDDQHGTAIVVLAALLNAATVVGKDLGLLSVAVVGAGAAGIACAKILLSAGIADIRLVDSQGVLVARDPRLSGLKAEMAEVTNPYRVTGTVRDALSGADVLLGLSSSQVPESALSGMARDSIIFALSNPDPEVAPDIASRHAAIVATGRSDYPNQINNVLAFPGVFRGALDAGARRITEPMKLAAARAIADLASANLSAGYIIPSPFDERVAPAVAAAVAAAV